MKEMTTLKKKITNNSLSSFDHRIWTIVRRLVASLLFCSVRCWPTAQKMSEYHEFFIQNLVFIESSRLDPCLSFRKPIISHIERNDRRRANYVLRKMQRRRIEKKKNCRDRLKECQQMCLFSNNFFRFIFTIFCWVKCNRMLIRMLTANGKWKIWMHRITQEKQQQNPYEK